MVSFSLSLSGSFFFPPSVSPSLLFHLSVCKLSFMLWLITELSSWLGVISSGAGRRLAGQSQVERRGVGQKGGANEKGWGDTASRRALWCPEEGLPPCLEPEPVIGKHDNRRSHQQQLIGGRLNNGGLRAPPPPCVHPHAAISPGQRRPCGTG